MNRSTVNVSLNFSPRLSSKESIRVRTKCTRHRGIERKKSWRLWIARGRLIVENGWDGMFVKRGRFFRGLVRVGGEWKAIAKLFRNQCRAKINSCSTAVPNFRGNCAETGRGAKSERWGAETRGRLPTGQSHRDLCVLIPRRTFIYWLSLQDIATDFVTAQLFHISYPIHILFFIVFFSFCDFFYLGKYYFI